MIPRSLLPGDMIKPKRLWSVNFLGKNGWTSLGVGSILMILAARRTEACAPDTYYAFSSDMGVCWISIWDEVEIL